MKLIKLTDTHYIIVDDSEIKEGDFVFQQNFEKTNNQIIKIETDFQAKIANDKDGSFTKNKITHSTEPLEDVFISDTFKINVGGFEKGFNKIKQLSLPEIEEVIYGYNVEKMAEEYNKGNVITDVLVEYEEGKYDLDELRERHLKGLPHSYSYSNLKVNPKDNTITIKKVKDSWNREEVINIIHQLRSDRVIKDTEKMNRWIEENL